MRLPSFRRRLAGKRRTLRGQSLVEFALVAPLLLLLFAGAADFGRAFYAYVAVENAAKEGALFGSRSPLCDDASGGACADPNNVTWRVRAELREQGIRNPDGTELTPTVACLTPGGVPRGSLTDCAAGDIYEVALAYPFRLLTPILGSVIGDLDLGSASRAVVFNLAFDPTPGASINKFVSPIGAVNETDITTKCNEPDDTDANGFYRSPCRDSSTTEPNDFLTVRFEEGDTIAYRIVVGNNGAQTLSGVVVSDSQGSTGCSFASTIAVGATLPVCNYTRTAPIVPGAALEMDYDNTASVDTNQTLPVESRVRVAVEKPPAELRVLKWVSPFQLGGDGDGHSGGVSNRFGTIDDLTVTYRPAPEVSGGTAWFKIIVINTGGQPATGLAVSDSRGALPVNATCPAVPSTLNAGASWECRYSVPFSSTSPATEDNTVTATADNVTPDGNDTETARLRVAACTGTGNRTVPRLIGLTKAQAGTAWTAAGFTGTLTTWTGQNTDPIVTQNRPAYECVAATSNMTVTRVVTP